MVRTSDCCWFTHFPCAQMPGVAPKVNPALDCAAAGLGRGNVCEEMPRARNTLTLTSVPGNFTTCSISLGFIRAMESEVRSMGPRPSLALSVPRACDSALKPTVYSTNAASS